MPPKKDLSIRLSAELRDALDQAAAGQGETITSIVEAALAAHLGILRGPTLADRVRVLEAAVAELQRNATQRPTPSPDNATQRHAPPPQEKPKRKPPSLPPPVRVLSLRDAHARALAQGYTDKSRNAWRMEMQRHPERLAALGLAKIENGAGYQVLD